MAVSRNGLIAALDVGSSKVCCFIARADGGTLRVIGIGHQLSRGLRNGNVIDMEGAEQSIRAAVETAERMCGETIRDVYVSVNAGNPQSHSVGVEVDLAGHEVTEHDVALVLDQGRRHEHPGDREIVHSIPVGYTIDGSRGIKDPRGMACERLGVNMHVITAGSGPLRNLATCVARGHLRIAGRIVAPFAAGLACLVEDEMDLGVTLLDMGGGTTSLAVFYDGQLVHVDMVPLGGGHVTNDIARGLSTPLAHAERLKTLYGTVLPSPSDDTETIDVPQVGETDDHAHNQVPRSILTGIIKPRLEETLEQVRERLAQSGFEKLAGRRVVLTGGASQLQGVRELAARILDKQVRLGRPIRVGGLAEATGGPAFSACAGLLSYAQQQAAERTIRLPEPEPVSNGAISRIGRWLRTNF
ncbi:cell division protein FtsA [Ferrovibrio sp.]|uniref:cell division protein FtsA n=1 Tax=Ferrovibrio sp. TaxID=1917215 RepID=UPI002613F528|nr:cell division protein FtsA [Ferrovibrio sp.]